MSWDDLSPEHKALAFDSLLQHFGQADWQRELRDRPEAMMLATFHVMRGPEGLELSGWLDQLRSEMTITAKWANCEKRWAAGFAFRHARDHEEIREMIEMTAACLSRDIARESGKPTHIQALSFREAYEVLEKQRAPQPAPHRGYCPVCKVAIARGACAAHPELELVTRGDLG